MEASIKVFATPEAYRYIAESDSENQTAQKIIKEMLTARDGGQRFHFSDGTSSRLLWKNRSCFGKWPVSIHTREEHTENGLIRTVLLCSTEGENSTICDGGDDAFYEAVRTATEVPFV